MRNFESFTRLAVVILPSEEEYTKLLEKWDENPLRDSTVSLLELKGKFKCFETHEFMANF